MDQRLFPNSNINLRPSLFQFKKSTCLIKYDRRKAGRLVNSSWFCNNLCSGTWRKQIVCQIECGRRVGCARPALNPVNFPTEALGGNLGVLREKHKYRLNVIRRRETMTLICVFAPRFKCLWRVKRSEPEWETSIQRKSTEQNGARQSRSLH